MHGSTGDPPGHQGIHLLRLARGHEGFNQLIPEHLLLLLVFRDTVLEVLGFELGGNVVLDHGSTDGKVPQVSGSA